MGLNAEIFRQYDIRGVVGKDLTEEKVEVLGKGIGTYLRGRQCQQVAVGGDCRISSPAFAKVLSAVLYPRDVMSSIWEQSQLPCCISASITII